jgi:two-component system chemotaxis sensor kinase CheA
MSDKDLDAALATFFEESREMLDQMEQTLLRLEDDPDDIEELNALFRAAHTIKGSAGLFGLSDVVQFTHHVETTLDELRNRTITLDAKLSSIIFRCRDHIECLIDLSRDNSPLNDEQKVTEASLLADLVGGAAEKPRADAVARAAPVSEPVATAADGAWHISAHFGPDTYRDGFDPIAVISYLSSVGEVGPVETLIPPNATLESIDPESCYLGFEFRLETSATKSQIEDAFRFVQDDCQLRLIPPTATTAEYIEHIEAFAEDGKRIGEILVRCGCITERELAEAVAAQAAAPEGWTPQPIGVLLVEQQSVTEDVVEAVVKKQTKQKEQKSEENRMVRISAEKLDSLINLVGELVIAGAGASAIAQSMASSRLIEASNQVNTLVESVRNTALAMRMVPVGETFSRFRRVVRDVCAELGKEVELELLGSEAELDKSVVEKIADPLMHIVRNALDHGIEMPADRVAAGKPAAGKLVLSAFHDSGNVVIRITDDGRGINRAKVLKKAVERGLVDANAQLDDSQIVALLFAPGFSTADKVSNLSGRGVGMDVVKRNIESLRGTVSLTSQEGQGAVVEIRLPLTLAIIDGFLVRVGGTHFVLPLDVVVECINPDGLPADFETQATNRLSLRGKVLPVIYLRQLFNITAPRNARQSIVIVRSGGQQVGLVVDTLVGEYQTVIKPLGQLFSAVRGLSGSTILGSGEVALILEPNALVGLASEVEQRMNDYPVTPGRGTKAKASDAELAVST